MQCPKCQTEVPEGHFYCPNCCTQVQTYKPEIEKPLRGRFERAGARVLEAIVWMLIIAALVLTGRAVQWNEIFAAIRGYTDVSEKLGTDSKVKRASRTRSDEDRSDKAPMGAKTIEVSRQEKKDVVESARAMPQKIEELPSVQDRSQSQNPRLSAATVRVETAPVVTAPDSTSKSAIHSASVDAHRGIDIEQVDAKNSGDTGLVAINSYTPARIYINGQFSGITPRTIKLTPGDHQIRLIADGYEDWTRRFRLKTKQQIEVMASMKKKSVQKD